MSTLALRIEKHLDVPTEAGAVAVLHRLSDDAGVVIRSGQRLRTTIPASSNPQDVERIQVDPGCWWIEATLPSGEIIVDEVTVRAGEEKAFTLRASEHSPHEWLGWQHLLGNVEGIQSLARNINADRRDPIGYARSVITRSLEAQVPDSVRELVESTLDQYLSRALEDPFTGIGDPTVRISVGSGLAALRGSDAWLKIFDAESDPNSQLLSPFRASVQEGIRTYRLAIPVEYVMLPPRVFANVEWSGSRYLASLPTPWPAQQRSAEVELMVRIRPIERSVHLGVAVLDKAFGTLAGFMTASALPKARIFVNRASGMLFEKPINCLAAAAGGYVLLATGEEEKDQEWHHWIDNLAKSFPSIPDGAVLKARQYLRFPRNSESYDAAKASLFDAFDRGIPCYSAGVAWLLDGLTIFANEDLEAKERMRLVHKVAQRLDISQPFTVIRLSNTKKA